MPLALRLLALRRNPWLIAAVILTVLLLVMAGCEVPPGGDWKMG